MKGQYIWILVRVLRIEESGHVSVVISSTYRDFSRSKVGPADCVSSYYTLRFFSYLTPSLSLSLSLPYHLIFLAAVPLAHSLPPSTFIYLFLKSISYFSSLWIDLDPFRGEWRSNVFQLDRFSHSILMKRVYSLISFLSLT